MYATDATQATSC